jgi:alcohol dehydrogenase class IV
VAVTRYSQNAPVLFGPGAVNAVGGVLGQFGVKKALIVCDGGVKAAGISDKVKAAVEAAGVEVVVYDQVPPDPPDTNCLEAAALAKEIGAEAFIGVGGGSSIDTAKAANFALSNDLTSLTDKIPGPPIPHPLKYPVIAIPTTSGTGSEVTFVAVITATELGIKGGLFSPATAAILDPELTLTVPPHVTAQTGLDALAHAAESYTSVDRKHVHEDKGLGLNPKAAVLDLAAISKIFKWLPVAIQEPGNLEARTELMIAANFAGIGFSDTMVQLGHGVAEELGGKLHLPHGFVCAHCLPACLEITASAVPERIKDILDAAGVSYPADASPAQLGEIVADAVRALAKSVGLAPLSSVPRKDHDPGFSREEVLDEDIIEKSLVNWALDLSPAEPDRAAVVKVLADAYDKYQ